MNKMTSRSSEHKVNIRSSNNLSIPIHKTKKFEKSFSYLCPKICNMYILVHDNSATVTSMRKNIKYQLLTSGQHLCTEKTIFYTLHTLYTDKQYL